MNHGAGLHALEATEWSQRQQPGIDPKHFAGFSYLLGEPSPGERSRWGEDLPAARDLLLKLALALPGSSFWPTSLRQDVDVRDNPNIPAGYTYLLQFVAHDMLQTSVPFWAAAGLGVDSENCRGVGLMLNTLYGGGPSACPAAFEPTLTLDENRFLLRLGQIVPTPGASPQGACPFRDLARVNVKDAYTDDAGNSVNFDNAYQVDVADARNDDGVILTQLTVLFAKAHNIIAANVQSASPEAKFCLARAAMLMIYHAVIGGDLLPRLLHPDVWGAVKDRSAESGDWLWQQPGLPLEFSHGAFRLGHAMVRGAYKINSRFVDAQAIRDVVAFNQQPTGTSRRKPLLAIWILEWSYFFELSARAPNFSLRIGPSRTSLDLEGMFPMDDPHAFYNMTLRDFLSAATARMWNVDALIKTIAQRSPGLIPPGWFFANPAERHGRIAGWLADNATGHLDQQQIASFSSDPPLPLFVLLEAGLDPDPRLQGRCMGVLGSIIVAEVLCKRLATERARLDVLKIASESALPADLWARISAIDSMPALVNFVADFGGLRGCDDPPFI